MSKKIFEQSSAIKETLSSRVVRGFYIFYGVMIAAMASFVYWRLFPGALNRNSVPLHYNVHVGVDAFGLWWMLFFPPAFAFLLAIFGGIFVTAVYRQARRQAYLVLVLVAFIMIVLAIGTFFSVLLNISYD